MQDIIKKLSNKRQANVFFKNIELTQLTRIIETLQSVKEEKELNAQIEA
ncbi:H-NS family histone-like protein, partial [Vibrio artabrorum]